MITSPHGRRISIALAATLTFTLALTGCGQGDEETAIAADGTPIRAIGFGQAPGENQDQDQNQPETTVESQAAAKSTPSAANRIDPNVLLRAMGLPVELRAPDSTGQAEISAIELRVGRDETRRENYTLTIEVASNGSPQDLAVALTEQPILPPRGIHIPLPDFDHFYDWSDPRIRAESEGSGSLATVSTSSRRQGQGAGDEIVPGETAALLRQLAYDRGLQMGPSGSSVRWEAAEPDMMKASLSMQGSDRTRSDVIDWLRGHALPGTFQSTFAASNRDDRIDANAEAVLAGPPAATATWRGGSYLDSMRVTFSYGIDGNGLPLPDQAVAVAPDLPVLIPLGSQWRIDSDGTPDDGWTTPGFDDSGWRTASGPFVRNESVRGAAQIATRESGDPVWFRHGFDLEDPANIEALEVSFMADDGAVVYLNGVEVHRWNLPAGPIDSETLAVARISGEDEAVLHVAGDLPAAELRSGQNVLAIAVFQASTDSSDARFDAQLVAWPTGSQ